MESQRLFRNSALGYKENCDPKHIYNSSSQNIYALILKQVGQKDVTKDLISETFKRLCIRTVDGKECNNPKAYLYRIALNLVIDYFNNTGRRDAYGSYDFSKT